MNVGLFIMIVFMLSLLGLAWWVSRNDKKSIREFATADSSLGVFVLTLTLSATYHSAYAFLGAGGFVYTHGIGWWSNGLWTVLPGVLFWVWGRRFWFLGKTYGYISVADAVSDIYQSRFHGLLVTLVCMIFTVPYVAMQAIGSGYIFQTISGGTLSYEAGTIIFFIVMVMLVWVGGMKGVAFTDAAQGVFMWVGLVAGSWYVLSQNFGGVSEAYQQIANFKPELLSLPGPKGLITSSDWISRWIVITVGMMMFPHITLRFFSGKSLKVLKWSSVFSSIYLTSIYIFTPAIGMAGHILIPGLGAPDTVFPELLLKYTPLVFASLIVAGALAASMSTGDSQLHAVSSMVSTDIYRRYIDKDASDYKLYKVAKISIVVFGLISVGVALTKPGLLGNILALSNGGVAALAPTVIGGIYWKRCTAKGGIASIIAGESVLVYATFINPSPLGIMAGMWALVTSIIVYITVCKMTPPNPKTEQIVGSIHQFFSA